MAILLPMPLDAPTTKAVLFAIMSNRRYDGGFIFQVDSLAGRTGEQLLIY
jgi:hypothetical protein